jgi:hypothetical protein
LYKYFCPIIVFFLNFFLIFTKNVNFFYTQSGITMLILLVTSGISSAYYMQTFFKKMSGGKRMKKHGFGMLWALLALSMVFVGCPTESSDDGGVTGNEVGTGGQSGQTLTVTFKSNYLGLMNDASDIPVQVEYDQSLGLKLPSTGSVQFANADRPSVSGFANVPTGRQFKEWNTKLDGSGITFTATTRVKGNVTIYAIWEGKYNLSNSMYANLFELTYNSYGGKDAQGIYNYQAVIPIGNFGGIPGKILSGKTLPLKIEMVPCYDVGSAISISLVDASGTGTPGSLSNGVTSADKPRKGVKIELSGNFTTTAAAADYSPEANALLISADLPIFTEKLPLYASVSPLATASGQVEPSPEFTVNIVGTPKASLNYDASFEYQGTMMTISQPSTISSVDNNDVTFTLSEGMPMYGIPGPTEGGGGFVFASAYNLSAYSKVEVVYTANSSFVFKPMSIAFTDTAATDTIQSATTLLAGNNATQTITLVSSKLSTVQSILLDGLLPGPPLGEVTIHRITFKQ